MPLDAIERKVFWCFADRKYKPVIISELCIFAVPDSLLIVLLLL